MKKRRVILFVALFAMLLGALIAFVGCGKDEVEKLYKPTNIAYDGSRITWDKVALADHYTVKINDGEEKRVNTNMYTYTDGGEFDVTVKAVNSATSASVTVHFTPLDTIETISVSADGVLTWDEITGATAYRISLNGTVLPTDVTEARYAAAAGSNRIKIRPVVSGDNGYYSLWSAEKQVFVNSAPTNIKYDGEKLTWSGNASDYEVTVNGQPQSASGTQLRFDSKNRDFTVSIKAVGDHITSFDSVPAEEEFHYLAPATGLVVENGVLSWNKVENAAGYRIKINNVVQQQKVSASETPCFDKLAAGAQLAVSVLPYNDDGNWFSSWSVEKNIYILPAPVVSWNADLLLDGEANNNFIWNIVESASGYKVEVERDGNKTYSDHNSATTAFAHAYSEVGVYKVRVKAVAAVNSDRYDSKYSDEITVQRLAAPKAAGNNYIESDPADLSRGFTVNYTSVSGATGYQLYKDGAVLDGKRTTATAITDSAVADDTVSAVQNYTYAVQSLGGVKTVSGKKYVYLPCLTESALSFNITVQAMPENLAMSGFNAAWSPVAGVNGYAVNVDNTSKFSSSATSYDLSTITAGAHNVSVCSRGNGGATLASNYTAAVRVERLAAPTNIRISYGTGDGQLTNDPVANAKSYHIYLDQSDQALPENAFDNMYQYIQTSGTVLHMTAVGNYYNDLGTVYYMTSAASPTQQFIRLKAPTFPEGRFSNSVELVWNASDNINTQEYTPTYQVYESDVMQSGGIQNGTRFNLASFAGGAEYTFRVKAVGNDSKYLDSELSAAVSVYKLAAPTIRIEDDKYKWSEVVNASSYVLEIDGVRVDNSGYVSSGDGYSFVPDYTQKGDHTVRLTAIGDGYNTINSNAYEYTQKVDVCLAPGISYAYSSANFEIGGKITVQINTASQNAKGYLYEIAGVSVTSAVLTASQSIESTGVYKVRVKALGGKFDENGVYYLDSQFAGGGTGYTITLLAPPTVGSFKLNSYGALSWATITDAKGYDYTLKLDGTETTGHTGTASLDPIENHENYKTISITLRACGDGVNVIGSEEVTYTWTNPRK